MISGKKVLIILRLDIKKNGKGKSCTAKNPRKKPSIQENVLKDNRKINEELKSLVPPKIPILFTQKEENIFKSILNFFKSRSKTINSIANGFHLLLKEKKFLAFFFVILRSFVILFSF